MKKVRKIGREEEEGRETERKGPLLTKFQIRQCITASFACTKNGRSLGYNYSRRPTGIILRNFPGQFSFEGISLVKQAYVVGPDYGELSRISFHVRLCWL